MPTRILLLLAVLALGALAPTAEAKRTVPRGWLGTIADGPLTGTRSADHEGEWGRMAASGAEVVRTAFYWNEAQPYATFADVPPERRGTFRDAGGVPTDFSPYDKVVASAARRRIGVLPIVHRTPFWAAEKPGDLGSPPKDPQAYAAFLRALVGRYGPGGSFWAENPGLPRLEIHSWQIWNEPNITRYWTRQPFARSYVALLRAADAALKSADPRARTVLAGLPNESFRSLRAVYKAGGKGAFDVVALHPYTGKPRNVVKLVSLARKEIRRAGDRALPVWITELSWPASVGKATGPRGFTTTDRGQAARLKSALRLLAKARKRLKIQRVYWYTWLSDPRGPNSFDYSGLRRVRGDSVGSAPALREFRRAARRLQGCAKSPDDATRCISSSTS